MYGLIFKEVVLKDCIEAKQTKMQVKVALKNL